MEIAKFEREWAEALKRVRLLSRRVQLVIQHVTANYWVLAAELVALVAHWDFAVRPSRESSLLAIFNVSRIKPAGSPLG